MNKTATALLAVGLASLVTSAHADVFDFTISSKNGDVIGQFTTMGGPSEFIVVSATGSISGNAISLLNLNTYGNNDNKLFEPAPYLDPAGVAFTAGGLDYNIFRNDTLASPGVYSFCVSSAQPDCTNLEADHAPVASFTLTAAVPEPSTWAMMILGFAGIGAMTYRRRKQNVTPFSVA
jgi:hypothetical protein